MLKVSKTASQVAAGANNRCGDHAHQNRHAQLDGLLHVTTAEIVTPQKRHPGLAGPDEPGPPGGQVAAVVVRRPDERQSHQAHGESATKSSR